MHAAAMSPCHLLAPTLCFHLKLKPLQWKLVSFSLSDEEGVFPCSRCRTLYRARRATGFRSRCGRTWTTDLGAARCTCFHPKSVSIELYNNPSNCRCMYFFLPSFHIAIGLLLDFVDLGSVGLHWRQFMRLYTSKYRCSRGLHALPRTLQHVHLVRPYF